MLINNTPRYLRSQSFVFLLFLMVLFMLPIRGRAESSRIEQFLTRVQNLPESRRQAQVETFTRTYPHSPVIANGDVLFYYRGSGIEKISITADWNAWRKPDLMENIPGTDFHYFKKSFEADACLRYNYMLGDKNLLDPRNPRQAWHWENKASELRMPGYKTPAEFIGPANPIKGTLLDLELESKNLKETRHLKIYLPPGYQTGNQRYPVLYTQDGFAFVRRFEMIRSIEWGLVKNNFSPFIAVFVEPVDRGEEYRGSKKESYKAFFVSELVPYIDSRYRTRANAGDRALIGSSRGGLISLDLGFHYPGIFSQVAALSPAIPPTDMIDIFRNGEKKNLHIYMSIGRYEPRWLKDALRLRDVLKEKGYRLTFYNPNEGHSIYSWRAQFGTIFKIFFGEQGNGSGTIRGRASSFPAGPAGSYRLFMYKGVPSAGQLPKQGDILVDTVVVLNRQIDIHIETPDAAVHVSGVLYRGSSGKLHFAGKAGYNASSGTVDQDIEPGQYFKPKDLAFASVIRLFSLKIEKI